MFDKVKENILAHNWIAKKYDLKHTEIYNCIEQERIKSTIRMLLRKLNKKNPKILDFGAGTGNLTRHFVDLGCEVTACDVSQESLNVLKKKNKNVKTVLISGKKLPFKNNSFDAVVTYSVLHHVPDYLFAVKEMVRVTKRGGFVYIDHEVNNNYYFPGEYLKEYQSLTKQNKIKRIIKLLKINKLFTWNFIRIVFIKLFINSKYSEEGDLHIWKEDRIEWERIYDTLKKEKCDIVKEVDYLMYRPEGGRGLYNKYKKLTDDTRYIVIKK